MVGEEEKRFMNTRKSIQATKKEFEESFSTGDFYNKQTQDEAHLNAILEFCQ